MCGGVLQIGRGEGGGGGRKEGGGREGGEREGGGREGRFLMLHKSRTHPFSPLALFLFLLKASQHTSDAVIDTSHDATLLGTPGTFAELTVCLDHFHKQIILGHFERGYVTFLV